MKCQISYHIVDILKNIAETENVTHTLQQEWNEIVKLCRNKVNSNLYYIHILDFLNLFYFHKILQTISPQKAPKLKKCPYIFLRT